MKKKKLFLIFLLLFGTVLTIHGQVVNQDAEGKSTIFFPGGVIGIELGESALTFNFMNIPDITKTKSFLWGISARGENKSGIIKLFASGKMVPNGSFMVTFGYHSTSDSYMDRARWEKLQEEEKEGKAKKEQLSNEMDFYIEISKEISNSLKEICKKEVIDELNGIIEQNWWEKELDKNLKDFLDKNLKDLTEESKKAKLKGVIDKIINILENKKVESLFEELNANEAKLVEITNQRIGIEKNASYTRSVFFSRIGVNAGSFKSYSPSESSDLKDQFKKIEYSSFSFQIGMNKQLGGNILLGFAVGFQKANNLGTLSKKEFTINTTQISGNQKLVEEEKIIAYSGEFKKFDRLDIDSDIVGFVKVGKTHVMTPYGYFRWRIPIGAGDSFAKTMNIGFGANFLNNKGKHLGGLFLELPDITNELKDDRKLLNRLTLGITVQITFAKSNSWIPWFK